MTERQSVGVLGEAIAVKFLMNKGFSVIGRNYRKPWGELDIICKIDKQIVFVEVKSVSRETSDEDHHTYQFRPEDNMHQAKIDRLQRAIQTYLSEKHLDNLDWRLDLVAVKIDFTTKKAICAHTPGIY
jgi:putative endonuclease